MDIVDIQNGAGETKHGYINIRDAIARIRLILIANDRITIPSAYDIIDELDIDDDETDGYYIESIYNSNVMMLIPRAGDNIIQDESGNQFVRLSEMLNFLSNQPRKVSDTDPDDLSGQIGGGGMLSTQAQLAAWMNAGAFKPEFSLNSVMIDFKQLDKQHRGIMSFITNNSSTTITMQAGFNNNPYIPTQGEVNAGITQSTTQGLKGNLSALSLPQVRVPSKNSDQEINAVFSAARIDLQNLSFEYENFKMEKLTLIPTQLELLGFRYDIKNSSPKKK